MPEPSTLVAHATWILGLALLLAAWSYRSWAASVGVPSPAGGTAPFMLLGALLFALGMLASSGAQWERIGWGVVLLLLLVEAGRGWRRRRAGP